MKIVYHKNYVTIIVNTEGDMEQAINTANDIFDQSGIAVRLENVLGDPIADLDNDGWQYWNMF